MPRAISVLPVPGGTTSDQRGYNLSDKPAGVASYDMRLLVGTPLP